jgi:hypothetical protein
VNGYEVGGEGKTAAKRSLPRTADLVDGDRGGRGSGSGQRLGIGGRRINCSGRVGTALIVVG